MKLRLTLLAMLSFTPLAFAQDMNPAPNADAATTAPDPFEQSLDKALADASTKFKDDANVFVRRGVIADRTAQTVTIRARFTGVSSGDAVEFFLVGPDSGKDYESLAVSGARASDVHAAIEFLGQKAGRPVNYRENRLWPKGERVEMTFSWDVPAGTDKAGPTSLRAEEMMVDPRTDKPLPADGFMFVGSTRVASKEGGEPDTYLADVSESRSIVSNYNEPGTVLDVPGQAVQGAVYGFRKMNPAVKFDASQPVTVTLRPMRLQDGSTRVSDLKLTVDALADRPATSPAFQYNLIDQTGKKLSEGTSAAALAAVAPLVDAGHDVFVTVTPSDAMTLSDVRRLYALIDAGQGAKGLRIEPAPSGHLFWRSFFPQEEWRDAKVRLGEPWELHVRFDERAALSQWPRAMLRQFNYDDNQELKTKDFNIETPDELAKILKDQSGRWTDGVFVFAPPEMTYGQLMSLIRPGLSNVNWWYVFPPVATTQPVQMP